jgi:hypothetical protein
MHILQGQNKHYFTKKFELKPVDALVIAGVQDIAHDFDLILFSANQTISNDNRILPAGVVLVPSLRKNGKKLCVFSVEQDKERQELTNHINRVGLSFSTSEVLLLEDLNNLEKKFPLTAPHRILMVCSNLIEEVALGKSLNLTTLLIDPIKNDQSKIFGIWPHYIASSV